MTVPRAFDPGKDDVLAVLRDLAFDRALVSAAVANALALVYAIHSGFGARDLIHVYFLQSLAFGAFHTARICALRDFSVASHSEREGYVASDAEARGWETRSMHDIKYRAAAGFLPLWLLAHTAFLGPFFILLTRDSATPADLRGIFQCLLIFLLQQSFMLILAIRRDRMACPSIGAFKSLPFARLAPLLATVVLAVALGAGTMLLVALAVAKTAGDGLLQMIEERTRRGKSGA